MPTDVQLLGDLDPRWTALICETTRGEDFLGLRAVQGSITGYLLPGIITITPRARYYPFYSWLLVEYEQSSPEGMSLAAFIKHREQIFVLANLAWSDTANGNPHGGGLLGSDKLGKHWLASQDAGEIPLSVDDYLEARYGGYGQYAGVMRSLGLIRQPESGILEVLDKGRELAEAFADAIGDTRYYEQRTAFDTAESIHRDVLEEYGMHCLLSRLATSPDRLPTLEALFAFDAAGTLPPPGTSASVGNMKGTLGLILDMLDQAEAPFPDDRFRQASVYGLCTDYDPYQPAEPLRPFLAHWRMFQLREYYVYALYTLWAYFLYWLRLEGPQTLQQFRVHLNKVVDLAAVADAVELTIPSKSASEWALGEWLGLLLDLSDTPEGDWESRCSTFAQRSRLPLNEHALYQLLDSTRPSDPSIYVGVVWLLLSTLHLRLRGLRDSDQWGAWHWANFGGARRRSMALFVQDMDTHIAAEDSILDTWSWLYRDYVIAQHTITALEKWQQRKANTFHFNYEQGFFEWVRGGRTGFSASRFRQAYDMLADLGLYEIDLGAGGRPRLTELGQQTLQRVLEACSD